MGSSLPTEMRQCDTRFTRAIKFSPSAVVLARIMRAGGKKFEQNSARRDTMVSRGKQPSSCERDIDLAKRRLIRRSVPSTRAIGTIGFTWAIKRLSLPPVGSITCAGALGSDA